MTLRKAAVTCAVLCAVSISGSELFTNAGLEIPGTIHVKAEEISSNGLIYETNGSGGIVITGVTSSVDYSNVVIPETINGKKVVEIGSNAFKETDIEKLTVGSNVTKIGSHAFYNCYKLKEADMGKNVTTIGDYAFASSTFSSSHATIEKLILPDKIENIGNYFVSNTIIKNVTIRSGCNRISRDILDNTGLQTINVESGNKIFSSDKGVLYETKYSSKGKVTDKVLVRCPKVQTFTTYSVPEDVTVIGESAFSNCKNLSRLVLPRKLKSLKKNALNVNIDTLVIPDKIKKIASQNGMYSHNISSLEVPSTVSYISSLWYDNLGVCFDLKSINVDANNKYFSSSDGVLYNKKTNKAYKNPLLRKILFIYRS